MTLFLPILLHLTADQSYYNIHKHVKIFRGSFQFLRVNYWNSNGNHKLHHTNVFCLIYVFVFRSFVGTAVILIDLFRCFTQHVHLIADTFRKLSPKSGLHFESSCFFTGHTTLYRKHVKPSHDTPLTFITETLRVSVPLTWCSVVFEISNKSGFSHTDSLSTIFTCIRTGHWALSAAHLFCSVPSHAITCLQIMLHKIASSTDDFQSNFCVHF